MRRAYLSLALLALSLPAGAADAVSALALARAQVLAVQLPQAGEDTARGDPAAYFTLTRLRTKTDAVRAELPPDGALTAAWDRLAGDLDALLDRWPASDAAHGTDDDEEATARHRASQTLRADAIAFVQRADQLLGADGAH